MQNTTRGAPPQPDPAQPEQESPVNTASPRKAAKPRFGADLQAQIGIQLRAMHHDVLNEKVPDRFIRLLEELAKKQAAGPHE